jgi:hypothetical protein
MILWFETYMWVHVTDLITERYRHIFVQISLFPVNRLCPAHFRSHHSHFRFRPTKKNVKVKTREVFF